MAEAMLAALCALVLLNGDPCYVQAATPGCRVVEGGRPSPLRSFRTVPVDAYVQAPRGGSLTVVFRGTGARFRLDGLGQAKVGERGLLPVRGAKVAALAPVDTRLSRRADDDGRFGRQIAAAFPRAGTPVPPERRVPPLPKAAPRPLAEFTLPPPPVPPLAPDGNVTVAPTTIRVIPAPPDGRVRVEIEQSWPSPPEPMAPRFEAEVRNGAIAVPPGFFGVDVMHYYVVRDEKDKRLASGTVRVMTPGQVAALEEVERLALVKGDDESLGALAMLYEDLQMPESADRTYRRLLARHPDDPGLREKVGVIVRKAPARAPSAP